MPMAHVSLATITCRRIENISYFIKRMARGKYLSVKSNKTLLLANQSKQFSQPGDEVGVCYAAIFSEWKLAVLYC